jgi:hypothetical protein
MWTAILGILNGFLAVADKLLSSWQVSQERQAGRNEVELENAEKSLTDMEKANEIDSRPPVTNRTELLKRLRGQSGDPK